jgi:hypothetical protein
VLLFCLADSRVFLVVLFRASERQLERYHSSQQKEKIVQAGFVDSGALF